MPEETGTLSLLVVRAQGLLGEVSVEWRTVDGSARSAGKTPEDYTVRNIYIVCVCYYCLSERSVGVFVNRRQ